MFLAISSKALEVSAITPTTMVTHWPSVGPLLHQEHKSVNEQTEVAIPPRKCCHPSSVGSFAGGVDD